MRATGWRMAAAGGIAAGLLVLLWAGPASSGGFMSKAAKAKDTAPKDSVKDANKSTPAQPPSKVQSKGPPRLLGTLRDRGPANRQTPSRTAGPGVLGGTVQRPGGAVSGGGNLFGIGTAPRRTVSPPRPTQPDSGVGVGGFFRRVERGGTGSSQGTPVIGKYYGSSQGGDLRPVLSTRPGGFFASVDRQVQPRPSGTRHSGSGYFASVQDLERRQHVRGTWRSGWWWYYPYDFRFYHWYYGYYDPFDPYYPFAAYVYYPVSSGFYYVYSRPVVLVTPPALWLTLWVDNSPYRQSRADDYYPYMGSVKGSLGDALRDIERAWRTEDIDLLMRHVNPEWDIRVLYGDEYSHTLSGTEFEDLTRDAFRTVTTDSFRFTSVKRHRDEDEAVAKGVHELRDPNGERRVVYIIYLLEESRDRYGDWDWYIKEVGQSPEPY